MDSASRWWRVEDQWSHEIVQVVLEAEGRGPGTWWLDIGSRCALGTGKGFDEGGFLELGGSRMRHGAVEGTGPRCRDTGMVGSW